MSYIISELQEIIKALKKTQGQRYQTKFRIADFAVFGLKISDAKGQKSEFESLLDRVGTIQKDFAVEEDSLVYTLKILCALDYTTKEYSSFELYKRLLDIASKDHYDIPEFKDKYKSVKSLTRRIANIKGNITNDVIVKIRKGRSNSTWYTLMLADKDFELPPTQFDINEKAMDMVSKETLEGDSNELFLELHAIPRCRPTTVYHYKGYLKNHILPCFGHLKLIEINSIMIKQFLSDKTKTDLANSSINKFKKLMGAIFNMMMEDGIINHNPAGRIKSLKEISKIEIDPLNQEEVKSFLNKTKKAYPDFYPLAYTAIYTGMRQGELLALTWSDINWKTNKIIVSKSYTHGRLGETKTVSDTILNLII